MLDASSSAIDHMPLASSAAKRQLVQRHGFTGALHIAFEHREVLARRFNRDDARSWRLRDGPQAERADVRPDVQNHVAVTGFVEASGCVDFTTPDLDHCI